MECYSNGKLYVTWSERGERAVVAICSEKASALLSVEGCLLYNDVDDDDETEGGTLLLSGSTSEDEPPTSWDGAPNCDSNRIGNERFEIRPGPYVGPHTRRPRYPRPGPTR